MTRSSRRSLCSVVVALLAVAGAVDAQPVANIEVPIVFAAREMGSVAVPETRERQTAVERAEHGRLVLRAADGSLQSLVDSRADGAPSFTPTDVLSPEVSYDGRSIVFSGFSPEERAWRIYEVQRDGGGLRQITTSDRDADLSRFGEAASAFEAYDDLDPCYMPDGRICFVSTRYAGSVPETRARATNLYVVNADGSDVHRITSERFGGDSPTVDPRTGEIVYSRWWRTPEVSEDSPVVNNPDVPPANEDEPSPLPRNDPVPPGSPGYRNNVDVPPPPASTVDEVPPPSSFGTDVLSSISASEFPGVNSWFLSSIRPDGTDLRMFSGFHLDRVASQAYMPVFPFVTRDEKKVLGLFLTESPIYGIPGRFGLREYEEGLRFPASLGGPQSFDPDAILVANFVYSSVATLPDGKMLVTGSVSASAADEEPGRIGIFVQDGDGAPSEVVNARDVVEMDAVPVIARPRPPILRDRNRTAMPKVAASSPEVAHREGGTFRFIVENIFSNAPVDEAIPNAPPFGKNLAIEFYMLPQRTSFPLADSPILLERVQIPNSGRVEVELPAGVPLFEVLRQGDGSIPVGRDGQIFHVGGQNFGRAGGAGRCVGCHIGHSRMPVPADPQLNNLATSARVTASSVKTLLGNEFRPELLVDRRTDFFRSEWAASDLDVRPTVRLSWSLPVRAKDVVLYAARTNRRGGVGARSHVITGVTLRSFLLGALREERELSSPVVVSGTAIPLNPNVEIDAIELEITNMNGRFEGSEAPALSEIEVIGRTIEGAVSNQAYVRGDSDCSGDVNLTDAVATLDHLFRGGGELCCNAAADATGDNAINLTDPIFVLNYLFLGGARPSAPFPDCGVTAFRGQTCDTEVCR